jgi:hypothetical protein
MYGKEMENKDIVYGTTDTPAPAQPLIAVLNKYSSRK